MDYKHFTYITHLDSFTMAPRSISLQENGETFKTLRGEDMDFFLMNARMVIEARMDDAKQMQQSIGGLVESYKR